MARSAWRTNRSWLLTDAPTSRPGRDNARAFEAQVPIGTPHFSNPESGEKDQAGGVHIREFVAPQTFELAENRRMVLKSTNKFCGRSCSTNVTTAVCNSFDNK